MGAIVFRGLCRALRKEIFDVISKRGRHMITDPKRWSRIRRRILVDGESIKGVARSERLSRNTVQRILRHEHPTRYMRPKRLAPISEFEDLIHSMLKEDETRPQRERRSVAAIFRSIRDTHEYTGSYDTVRRCCRCLQVPEDTFVIRPPGDSDPIESLSIERSPRAYRLDPNGPKGR